MYKSGLSDMKKRNRAVIMHAILEKQSLSRIEIAKETHLSPSTVSALVGELLQEGFLTETGTKVSTAGRSRTELTINGQKGVIAVAEISHNGVSLSLFDMALGKQETISIAANYISGNDLLVALTSALFEKIGYAEIRQGTLLGIGLLFEKDMYLNDFNVMYSTGFSSASISLAEALFTQFRVPVEEEYSQNYTAAQIVEQTKQESANSAHISIGKSVIASVTIKGKPVSLKNGICTDLTPLLGSDAKLLLSDQSILQADSNQTLQPGNMIYRLAQHIGEIAAMLYTIFPLDIVFLSGYGTQLDGFISVVEKRTEGLIANSQHLRFESLEPIGPSNVARFLAERIRKNVLCAG